MNRLRLSVTIVLLTCVALLYAQEENMDTIADSHHLLAYGVAALLFGVFVMLFSNRVYYYRNKELANKTALMNTQLGLVLDSNKTTVWTYTVSSRVVTVLSNLDMTRKEYMPIDFSQLFAHDDFFKLRQEVLAICDSKKESSTMLLKGNKNGEDGSQKIYSLTVSVLHYDKQHCPAVLFGIQRDITAEDLRRENARKLALRFHTVFNSSLVDMIFYNREGILTEINDRACETFRITDRDALLKRKVKITDIPSYRYLDFRKLDLVRISSITDIDDVKQRDERIPETKISGKFYYEAAVNTIRDGNGELYGVIAAGRNITEMVDSHHRQQMISRQLAKATQDIRSYISDINYTLRVSGVRLVNYYPDSHELEISSDLNKVQFQLPQLRCMTLVERIERQRVHGLFRRMDSRRPGAFSITVRTILRDEQKRNVYLSFTIIPMKGKDGSITHYFGLCQNDTEMAYTETRLLEESKKAQETEELKNTFLLNMSYEIRTPLNAVLGFAQLFNAPHDVEDEPVFADEIKRNTADLLSLVNDILFISRLDAKMVEFSFRECDFSMLFDGYCYMGWSSLQPGVTVLTENPYSRLLVTIDEQNLGLVIQKLCFHAARFTKEGSIRAKYEYRHGELTISVEDTGQGMSAEMLPHAFERFVRDESNEHCGTGLDLPIVKELVEQMGGSIEIQSEKGKGTTVYVIIPCEMTAMEKKSEQLT